MHAVISQPRRPATFRPAPITPSIERGPAFALELGDMVARSLPRGLATQITVGIQAGVVEPPSLTCSGDDTADSWPAGAFRRELRLWLQSRVPSDWYGSLTIRAKAGRVYQVVISRSFA